MNITEILLVILLLLSAYTLVKMQELSKQNNSEQLNSLRVDVDKLTDQISDSFNRQREYQHSDARALREEILLTLNGNTESLLSRLSEYNNTQSRELLGISEQINKLIATNQQQLDRLNNENKENSKQLKDETVKQLEQLRTSLDNRLSASNKELRQEVTDSVKLLTDNLTTHVKDISHMQKNQLQDISKQMLNLTSASETKLEQLRSAVEGKLTALQQDNNNKLEQMRLTVDEKLHATLEKRLGESFKLVSDRLEQVHKGLGEMQTLALGVGDLKKVLSNVKTRGIWGEMQLAALLEQILTPEQYDTNVATKVGSSERVEFAIKLPGKDDNNSSVWLPIDSKLPQDDYQRLLAAQEEGNAELLKNAANALEARIKAEAKSIKEKYIDPPNTTDFAIMFLPIEGLYAEVLRMPGLCELLQREYRINITGPTTLGALLNSLQMGFRTLAIEKRSGEVWKVLGEVKTEFGKFGDVLEKTKEKIEQVGKSIDQAAVRTRAIERKLRNVQELPDSSEGELNEPNT